MSVAIATRPLQLQDGTPLEVSIEAPTEVSGDEWKCAFRVGERLDYARGVDSLQALQMAFEGVRACLSQMPLTSWMGGELGDFGVPRLVPRVFGLAFAKHMDDVIEKEIKNFTR